MEAAELGQALPDPRRDDAAIRLLHLVLDGHGIQARQEPLEAFEDRVLRLPGHRRPVLGVVAVVLAGEPGLARVPRLEIRRREPSWYHDEILCPGAAAGEGFFEVVSLAVVPPDPEGVDLPRPERGEVVDDRAGRARAHPDGHHLVGGPPGLNRDLGQNRVRVQVLVQEEIAEHGHAAGRKAADELAQPGRGHHFPSSTMRW